MSNDEAEKIRQLEEELEAARAKARVRALEDELAALRSQEAAAEEAATSVQPVEAQAAAETADEAVALHAAQEQAERQAQEAAAQAAAAQAAAAQAAAVQAAAAQAAANIPGAYPPQAPPAKKGGLIATLILLLVLLAATLAATFLAIRGDLRAPWATPAPLPSDVMLISADDLGPAPAIAEADRTTLVTFEALSQPATSAAPDSVASLAVARIDGSTPEIYGLSYVSCTSLDSAEDRNSAAVAAFVAAQNTDDALGVDRVLAPADYSLYFQQLTFGHLLADTRVTYNGYSAGAVFPIQAVLQKGTLVGYDRFGIPRVHCGSGVALTSPSAAEGEIRFSGDAWGDFDLAKIVALTPASTAQTSFVVLPVGPSNVETAFSIAPRQCAWSAGECPPPTDFVEAVYPGMTAVAGPAPSPATCSSWAPGTSDADAVSTRIVNASSTSVQAFLVRSAAEGCGTRFDFPLGVSENRNITSYWPGSRMVFTDGTSATILGEYLFGEQTLFVIR